YGDYGRLSELREKSIEPYESETGALGLDASSVIVSTDKLSIVRSLSSFYVYNEEDETDNSMIFTGEEALASLASRVLYGGERPKAYFTTGHGENASVSLKNILYNAGYDIVLADLSLYDIGEDCGLVVIANPSYDFEEYKDPSLRSEISRLKEFTEQGGTVWVFRSPSAEGLPRLDAFLSAYGMTVPANTYLSDPKESFNTYGTTLLLKQESSPLPAFDVPCVMGLCAPVTLTGREGLTLYPLFSSSSGAEAVTGEKRLTDENGFPVAVLAETDGGGRIFLASAKGIAEKELTETDGFANRDLLFSLIAYGDPSLTVPEHCGELPLNMSPLEGMTRGTANRYFAVLTLGVPLAFGLFGAVLVRRRKNR
ncbi:MAG: GldG family protein, partial [Clostridia bacterium]|nr:GldG family protein [Clostridia bacterium]